MKFLPIIKALADIVSSATVASVVTNVVKSTTPETAKPLAKVSAAVGTSLISLILGQMAANYVSDSIDSSVRAYETSEALAKGLVDSMTKKKDVEFVVEVGEDKNNEKDED